MPYVNIKVTREGVTTEQKEMLIRETTTMLARVATRIRRQPMLSSTKSIRTTGDLAERV